jgi:hypothetical protein
MLSKFSFIASILIILFLSGCSQKIFKDNISDVAATGASATCTLINPVVGFVCGAATGIVVNNAIPIDESPDLSEIPEEQRAEVLKNQQMWKMIESLGVWAIGGIAAFFIIPLVIGYVMPNRRQRKLERIAFDRDDIKATDLE